MKYFIQIFHFLFTRSIKLYYNRIIPNRSQFYDNCINRFLVSISIFEHNNTMTRTVSGAFWTNLIRLCRGESGTVETSIRCCTKWSLHNQTPGEHLQYVSSKFLASMCLTSILLISITRANYPFFPIEIARMIGRSLLYMVLLSPLSFTFPWCNIFFLI
jgi:hypothetical protein